MSAKKITLATIKAFVRKNAANLYVKQNASFDGMTDCVMEVKDTYRKVESIDLTKRDTLGIPGAWFVRDSRDYFYPHSADGFTGFQVSNCCGRFVLAVPEESLT